jgi:hypothetical protein
MVYTLRRQAADTNPIIWQEYTHQRRSSPPAFRRWGALFGPLLLISSIALVCLTLTDWQFPTRDLAIFAIWIAHMATAIRAIAAGGNAISREHVGQTWDALVLTGVSARKILFGKWTAALRRVAPWMLALGTIRLVMLPVFIMALINRFAWRISVYNTQNGSSGYSYYAPSLPDMQWIPLLAIGAVTAVVVMTILEVMACTAIGLAASAIARRGVLAFVIALSVRFIPVALFAAFTRYEVGTTSISRYATYRMMRYPLFSLADSGTAAISQLVMPVIARFGAPAQDAFGGLLLAAGLLLVLLGTSLLAAWVAIRMTGALPHPKEETAGTAFGTTEN